MKKSSTISICLSVFLCTVCIVGCTMDIDLDAYLEEENSRIIESMENDPFLWLGNEETSESSQSESQPVTEKATQKESETATEKTTQKESEPATEKTTQKESQPATEKTTQKESEPATEKTTQKESEKATEKQTQTATQKATQPPTEPPTQPPTEAVTEAPVQPATEEATQPPVSPEVPTEAETPAETQGDSGLESRIAANMESYAEFIQEVVRLTNEQREQYGHPALAYDETLTKVAMYRSIECADNNLFSHTRPDGTNFGTVLEYYGVQFSFAAENIARGHTSPEMVMEGWLRSDGHRANIMSEKYTSIGIGISIDSKGRLFWTQIFKG